MPREAILGCVIGFVGGRVIALVLNRLALAQGLHAPFVAVSALVVFAFANAVHASGFLAVYLAGLVVGNRQTRAHNSVVVFLDAVTWLAQIVMFVLLGLLVWPQRLADSLVGAIAVALVLMLVARPVAVFLCLAPFNFQWREKLFISWVGLRGAVGIFLASIPLLVGLPAAYLFFDVAFVVVLLSLLVQGWTVAFAARKLDIVHSRAAIRCRAASSSICPASWRARSSAIRCRPTVRICAAASSRTGRGRRWSCATRRSSRRRKPSRCARAIMSICWRRRRRRRRSTASSSRCRRRRRPIRACSATSSCRARRRSARWRKSTACRSPPTIPR